MRYWIFVLPFLFVACKSIDIATPEFRTIPLPAVNNQVSTLTIPVQINLKSYLKEVETSLPMAFSGAEEQCEGISFSYRFFREPIAFTYKTDGLYYTVDGKFDLKLNYCPKCVYLFDKKGTCTIPRIYTDCGIDDPMRKVKVAYSTKINLTPTFKFDASTKLEKFDMLDPCKITVFNYDATSEVKKQVSGELKALEKEIDKQIESVDIRSSMKDVWNELQEPLAIESYGFLYLQPKALSLGKMAFSKDKVDVDLRIEAPRNIGEPIPKLRALRSNEFSVFGDMIHQVMVSSEMPASFPSLIETYGFAEVVNSAQLQTIVNNFNGWTSSQFGKFQAWHEIPFRLTTDENQVLNGIIDLALETEVGWILIDHKTYDGLDFEKKIKDEGYLSQLAYYQLALSELSKKPVLKTFLHFPMTANVVEISR